MTLGNDLIVIFSKESQMCHFSVQMGFEIEKKAVDINYAAFFDSMSHKKANLK